MIKLTPHQILAAYEMGMFPMAESAQDEEIFWVNPEKRGVFPLDHLQISTRLARTIRSDKFHVLTDRDFLSVICACARPETWINQTIISLYQALFDQGFVHTIEVYDEEHQLVGGLYGLAIGGAFFGESMFQTARDASKVALAHLAARLILGGFTLLDTQFLTPHLASLGAIEITRNAYLDQLASALNVPGDFYAHPKTAPMRGQYVMDIIDSRKA